LLKVIRDPSAPVPRTENVTVPSLFLEFWFSANHCVKRRV
jgi:hypothetical protein